MDTLNFTYEVTRKHHEIIAHFPFRVGDFVKINSSGGVYINYRASFQYFLGSTEPPFYHKYKHQELLKNPRPNRFKIINIACHSMFDDVVLLLSDNLNRKVVITALSVGLIKQHHLRKGENKIVKIDVIPSLTWSLYH